MVQFAGWEMPLVYEGTDKARVAGGAGEALSTTTVHSLPCQRSPSGRESESRRLLIKGDHGT